MHGVPRDAGDVQDFVKEALTPKPHLVVHGGDLPATVRALRDLLAASGKLFDRGIPVKLVPPADGGPPTAVPLTVNTVVMEAHHLCQPVKLNDSGEPKAVTLSERVARMYLDMAGEWNLPPLNGISLAPVLSEGGGILARQGYDSSRGLWCADVPALELVERPTFADAEAALLELRRTFRTFPFADAQRVLDKTMGIEVVDLTRPADQDESSFLIALMTAVCRSSLWLAPGVVVTAASISGSGSGKGLLIRAICAIAFGTNPRSFTAGSERQELDKRLAAELVEAGPSLFLDNANGAVLRSDTLASVLTERPARVRLLGSTRMAPLNSNAFVAVTGNGLTVSEDLARRFVVSELDARCENPEERAFPPKFLDSIFGRRSDLLSCALTIWRWGRQNASELSPGRPLGSFDTWCSWVRDPLLALGCSDPVERMSCVKAKDPHRRHTAELFEIWWAHHGDLPVRIAKLAKPVQTAADPQGRGRQYLAAHLARLVGTRVGGFVLTQQESVGKWGASTYALQLS
jgi:hypothetical protein